jgi:tripartite-type tricarboxylate transporter receptor subunit TctC
MLQVDHRIRLQLITWLEAKPDKALQGSFGIGTMTHLAGIFLQSNTAVRVEFVHYRGDAMQDLISGRIDMMIDFSPVHYRRYTPGRSKPLR